MLVITSTVPFPARANGITVRSNPILLRLAERYALHLLVTDDQRPLANSKWREEAAPHFASVCVLPVRRSVLSVRLGLLRALLYRPMPPLFSLHACMPDALRVASELISAHGIEVVLAIGPSDAHAILHLRKRFGSLRYVVDWIDSPALHAERVGSRSGKDRSEPVLQLEAWERMVNSKVDRAVYVSATDAQFAGPFVGAKVSVIPNGVLDSPPPILSEQALLPLTRPFEVVLGFLGNMGYEPNHAAAMRLCTELLPALSELRPDISFHVKVIGRVPKQELTALIGPKIEVTGAVESIWPEVLSVDIFVFPLTTGAGMQNKVLEAMCAARPTVIAGICAQGIPGIEDSGVVVCETLDDYLDALRTMLDDRAEARRRGAQGAAFVKRFDWEALHSEYLSVIEG